VIYVIGAILITVIIGGIGWVKLQCWEWAKERKESNG
jgi:hypothetical protein